MHLATADMNASVMLNASVSNRHMGMALLKCNTHMCMPIGDQAYFVYLIVVVLQAVVAAHEAFLVKAEADAKIRMPALQQETAQLRQLYNDGNNVK